MNYTRQIILNYSQAAIRLRQNFFEKEADNICRLAKITAAALAKGNKILLCGNGSSQACAEHIASELLSRFQIERPPLAALALGGNCVAFSAIADNYAPEQIFARQIQALGQPGDILILISATGSSPNLTEALKAASEKNIASIGFLGAIDFKLSAACDHVLATGIEQASLIQEVHLTLGHLFCQLIDYYLFENVLELTPLLQDEASQAETSQKPPAAY